MEGGRLRVDTRTKIVTATDLATLDLARPLLVVTGRFDILRTEAVRDLAAARQRTGARSLLVALRPLEDELVPLAARAEMAASLRVVDYVFAAEDGNWTTLAAALRPIEIVNLEEADAQRKRQLIEHVHTRQSA
jgi:bifunctional ADP-heptose synthase (sugar kinase/adenylyltransferase)